MTGDAPADASKDVVNELPQSCTTLDVSACADSGIPDGWEPVVTASNPGCPTTVDYDQPDGYVGNLGSTGSCTCGCTPTGFFSCEGQFQYADNCGNCGGGIAGCGTPTTVDAGGDASCFVTGNSQADLAVTGTLNAKQNGVGCDASTTSTLAPTSSPVTVCLPHCTADYCGVGSVYQRCIWSATQTTCPAPWSKQSTIGRSSDISVGCGCSCTPFKVGFCSATIDYYEGTSSAALTCSTVASGVFNTLPNCEHGGSNVVSFYYNPSPPTVSCDASAAAPTVGFNSPTTVCCL